MNDDQRARKWLLDRYEGRHQYDDEGSLAELLADVRDHERELIAKTRGRMRKCGVSGCAFKQTEKSGNCAPHTNHMIRLMPNEEEVYAAAVARLPGIPAIEAINAVANAFLGSMVHMHHPDGRHIIISPPSASTEKDSEMPDITKWTDSELDYNLSATAELLSFDLTEAEKPGLEALYRRCKAEKVRRKAIVDAEKAR